MSLPIEERAGGVVFQKAATELKYLLVTSNSNKNRWIFPAGHIEMGEKPVDAALREVMEEAGVEARIINDLGDFQYYWYRDNQKIVISTKMFQMEYLRTVIMNPEGRQVKFFRVDEIQTLNIWEETRIFIEKVHRRIMES